MQTLAALAVPALLLSACGSGDATTSTTTSATTSTASASAAASDSAAPATTAATSPALTPAKEGDLAGVKVAGTEAAPTVTLDGGKLSVTETTKKVLEKGTGETLAKGDVALMKIVAVAGTSGKTVYDSFKTGAVERWKIGDPTTLAGASRALLGEKIGTRMVAALPPGEAFGPQGQTDLGITKDDSVVFLIDIQGKAPEPLKEAKGTAVAPKAGMPTVAYTYGKPATITVPKTAAPTKLQSQNLIDGTGAVVAKGQTIAVHYTGVLWSDGKKFDSSFDRGTSPTEFAIGVGQVIPAWDKTLVGKKVGSRVLIVAPPADAYGANAQGAIPANSTLVFVVDILSAY